MWIFKDYKYKLLHFSSLTKFNDALFTLNSGNIVINGNETPAIVGIQSYIKCTWIGRESIAEFDWYLSGLKGLSLGLKSPSSNIVILHIGTIRSIFNGKNFSCIATTSSGKTETKIIALWTEGH